MRFLIMVIALPLITFGQPLEIESYAPNPSRELNGLWKLKITSNANTSIWLKAEVKQGGRLIYHATTDPVSITSGMNLLDQYKMQIRTQSFQNTKLEGYVTSTGKLPKGLYTGCVTVFSGQQELKTLCIEVTAENFSPPMLVFPFDGQELSQVNPTLSWIPPVPNAPGDIQYSVKLVEVVQGQTPQEALLKNPARFFEDEIETTTLPYPPSALPLEIDKVYAWQVIAFVGLTKIGITEIWHFKIVELNPEIKELISKQDYYDLSQSDFSRTITALKLLKLKYNEGQAKGRLTIDIYDVDGKNILKKPIVVKNKAGENYHKIDLTEIRGIKHENQYLMTINHGSKGLLNRLSFVYLDPEKYQP